MDIKTHADIDQSLCGTPETIEDNYARVRMTMTTQMTVDEAGLVHGGFVFGLADHAAMVAVNHPNVVLGAADVRFLKPVRPGETLTAEARVIEIAKRKHTVETTVSRGEDLIFSGRFDCFVLDSHVLSSGS